MYAILIEDKTNTKNHSDQLKIYKEALSKSEKYKEIIPIYLKTGYIFPKEEKSVKHATYKIFNAEDILSILNQSEIENSIFTDYKINLNAIVEKRKIVIDNAINNHPNFRYHYAQIKYLEMFTEKLNDYGHRYSIDHIGYGTNRSGEHWSELDLAYKLINNDEKYREIVTIRIDNNRKNPETKQYDYNFGIRQYCDLKGKKDSKNEEIKNIKLENLKKLKKSLPQLDSNSGLKYGKIKNDWSGKNASEIGILFFNNYNSPSRILNDFPKIMNIYIKYMEDILSYIPLYKE